MDQQGYEIFGNIMECMQQMTRSLMDLSRPSAIYKPTLWVDRFTDDDDGERDLFIAVLDGIVRGEGLTPEAAMLDFDRKWRGEK